MHDPRARVERAIAHPEVVVIESPAQGSRCICLRIGGHQLTRQADAQLERIGLEQGKTMDAEQVFLDLLQPAFGQLPVGPDLGIVHDLRVQQLAPTARSGAGWRRKQRFDLVEYERVVLEHRHDEFHLLGLLDLRKAVSGRVDLVDTMPLHGLPDRVEVRPEPGDKATAGLPDCQRGVERGDFLRDNLHSHLEQAIEREGDGFQRRDIAERLLITESIDEPQPARAHRNLVTCSPGSNRRSPLEIRRNIISARESSDHGIAVLQYAPRRRILEQPRFLRSGFGPLTAGQKQVVGREPVEGGAAGRLETGRAHDVALHIDARISHEPGRGRAAGEGHHRDDG